MAKVLRLTNVITVIEEKSPILHINAQMMFKMGFVSLDKDDCGQITGEDSQNCHFGMK